MPRTRKGVAKCIVCGEPCRPPKRSSKDPLCKTHALERMFEANRQLMAKSGPYYERWKAAVEAAPYRNT